VVILERALYLQVHDARHQGEGMRPGGCGLHVARCLSLKNPRDF
jgi:hypothetical protein